MPIRSRFHGRAPRLAGFDYTRDAWYFVTVVTADRRRLFGTLEPGRMVLSDYGQVAAEEIRRMADGRSYVVLRRFVVMPDHVHLLLRIDAARVVAGGVPGRGCAVRPPRGLGAMIGCMKASVTRRLNSMAGGFPGPVWQRGFHDRVVRDERQFHIVDRYIANNPRRPTRSAPRRGAS